MFVVGLHNGCYIAHMFQLYHVNGLVHLYLLPSMVQPANHLTFAAHPSLKSGTVMPFLHVGCSIAHV